MAITAAASAINMTLTRDVKKNGVRKIYQKKQVRWICTAWKKCKHDGDTW